MKYICWLLDYIIIVNVVTIVLYIAIMDWKKQGIVPLGATKKQKIVFAVGVFFDVLTNYTALTITMLQFPRRGEILATDRLKRTSKQLGWRGVEARGYCWLLNKFDAGHCG